MDHPFRTAAVGGFNKQDVLTYLEKMTKDQEEYEQSMQERLEEARNDAQSKKEELAELRAKVKESEGLRTRLTDAENELTDAKVELNVLRRKNDELARQVAVMAPSAEAYDTIKEKTAGLEMEALRRAQVVENEAKDCAEQLRRETDQWIAKVQEEYRTLRNEVEYTVSQAGEQLNRAGENLQRISVMMGEQKIALELLGRNYDEDAQKKEEAPAQEIPQVHPVQPEPEEEPAAEEPVMEEPAEEVPAAEATFPDEQTADQESAPVQEAVEAEETQETEGLRDGQ